METLSKEDFCFEISCSTTSSIERQNVSQPLNDYTNFSLFGEEKLTCHKIENTKCSIAHMHMNSSTMHPGLLNHPLNGKPTINPFQKDKQNASLFRCKKLYSIRGKIIPHYLTPFKFSGLASM